MKRIAIFALIAMLFLVACGGDSEEIPPTATAVSLPATAEATSTPIPAVPDQRDELTTQSWAWTRYLDQSSGPSDVTDPQNYVVAFLPDGTVQVKADCNSAAGSFTTNSDSLTITLGPTTLAACPEGSRSDQFLTLLGSAARYQISGGQLQIELFADAGSLFLVPESAVVVPTAVSASPTPPPPTAVPPTPVPPTAVPPTAVPGAVVDSGPRQYANGTYASPYYTVAAGDTLYSIGLRFGLALDQLIAANPAAAGGIFAGQTLTIPGAGVPAQPIEPPTTSAPGFERVTFAAGAISATLNGAINNAQPAGYVLRVAAGQVLEIATSSNGEPLEILVQGPEGTLLPVNGENGQINNNTWLPAPTTGDYYITVRPVTTPENPTLAFTITFVVQ